MKRVRFFCQKKIGFSCINRQEKGVSPPVLKDRPLKLQNKSFPACYSLTFEVGKYYNYNVTII